MTYNQPLFLMFLLVTAAGIIRLRRTGSMRLPLVGLFCLFLLAWEPFAWVASRPLEAWYPKQLFPSGPAQAIVVLGSYADPPKKLRPYSLPDSPLVERCKFAAWLYHNWHPLPIVVAAGAGIIRDQPLPVMRQLLQQAGVPDTAIWSEERSHDTHENAVYSAEILREH